MAKKINRKEACALLDISSSTLDRWRKKAGIYDQTSNGFGKKHLEVLKGIAKQRTKNSRPEKVSSSVAKKARNDDTFGNKMTTCDDDPNELLQLKRQYSFNLKLIEHLEMILRSYIDSGEVPDKNTADMMEKYQKLNAQTLKSIEKLSPDEAEDLESKVMGMLSGFVNGSA